jgi:hypothetical protein
MISPLRYRLEQLMKKARVASAPCLAIMAAGLLAGSAAAQDVPGRAAVGDGSYGFDRFGNRNYQLRSDIGDGVGYSSGYQTFGIFQPFMLEEDQSLLFVNPRGMVTYDSGHFAGSLGGGLRFMNPETERIFGFGAWWDHDSTGDFDYDQWGLSLESLGNVWDFRINGYIPVNDGTNVLRQNLTGNIFFVGNNIGLGRTTVYQSQFGGGDFELGGAIIPGFSDAGFRAYAGGYYLQGDDTIGAGYGVKGRVEALVTQNFLVNVGYSNDTFYDSNLTVALTWYFGTGEDARWFQRIPQTNRLYQQMERNYRNMVLTHEVSDFVKALRAGGTGGSGGAVGTPITVVHVNNTAGAGGDGSWERPLNSLPGTTGSNVDIIYVDRGNGTTQNMTGGIVLNDWQRLLGEGVQHTFTSTQGTFLLPGYSPGAFPSITNLTGNAVVLANHNEVSGFNIPKAGGSAIYGNTVQDFNLNNLNITDAGLAGIQIDNASGTGRITDVDVVGSGGNGIQIASQGSSVLNLTTRNVSSTENGESGLDVRGFDTSRVTLSSTLDTYSDNDLNGVFLGASDFSIVTGTFTTLTAKTNGVDGVQVVGTGNSDISASILGTFFTRSAVSSNQRDGIHMLLQDAATGGLTVRRTDILGNARDGIRVDLQDNSVGTLLADNNRIEGGSVGLTFFISGNTFLDPFSITNSSPVGGPNMVEFDLNLSGTLVYDTVGFAATPFAVVPPTQITTGLQTVNGTTQPPGWTVADNSQNLNLTFDDFAPTETFSWNIDIDPSPGIDGAVFGSDLIGSTVQATYEDGQILTGLLVGVAGDPDASTFVATSGLGGGNGINMVTSGNALLNSATITNNTIQRTGSSGVALDMSDNSNIGFGGVNISNNTITDVGSAGVFDGINLLARDQANQAALSGITIDQNNITGSSGNGVGLRVEDAALLQAVLRGNTISDNTLAGVGGSGLGTPGAVPPASLNVQLLDENLISGNDGGGVLFDTVNVETLLLVQNSEILNNGGIGIGATATNGDLDLVVGGAGLTDGVTIDGNVGAGIAMTLLDTATGNLYVEQAKIINTADDPTSPIYNGQGIDVRLSDSGVPATATATLESLLLFNNQIGSDTNAADGNAGAGVSVYADNATTVALGLIDGNVIANNGGDGLFFDRRNTATIDQISITNNLIDSNAQAGIEINARNANNDVNDYVIANNEITNSGADGVLLNVEADAQVNVDLFDNRIANNAGFGIHTTESINAQADTRHVDGEWHGNEIVNNGLAGIQLDSAVDDLSIGVPGDGNIISNNAGGGIVVNGPGTGQITDNTINNNGGTGIDLNITSSSVNQLNVWAISLNAIVGNAGDGIEILNNQARFNPATPGLQVTLTDNNIRRNAGRGIDILNRIGSSDRADLTISAAGNSIIENGLEGVYLVNTASTTQDQTSPATATLAADGAVNTRPRTIFDFTDNVVTGNGVSSAFNSTGLVIRVGTSDGDAGPTFAGGFFSGGRGGVQASVVDNTFGGNFGNDIFYQSFVSTVDPVASAGTWSDTEFTIDAYSSDPLARLDLTQHSNVFDSAAVTTVGAAYTNAEPDFKSRTNGATDPGPFGFDTRPRNAQRLAARFGLPPATPGGGSNAFLYPGLGQSTFRLFTAPGFDATAGFIFDTLPYTSPLSSNGVGADNPVDAMPFGWTLVP